MSNRADQGTKDPFIPANNVQKGLILDIQRAVAESPFCEQYHLNFIPETFKLYTVVIKFLDGIKSRLTMSGNKNEVSIGGLINISKSTRFNETAEKTGNMNSVIVLGEIGEALFKDGPDGFKDILMEDPIMKDDMMYAQTYAQKELMFYGYGYKPKGYDIYQSCLLFFAYLILTVKKYAENPKTNPDEFRIIIGSHFSVAFKRFPEGPKLFFQPSKVFKLGAKSDEQTES